MQFMCKVPHHLLRSRQFLVPSYLRYRTTNELAKNSSQTTIASFIENDGIIRVGGCLTVSQWPYGTMHSVMKAYTLDSQYYYLRPDYDFGRWGAMPSQQRSITCICAKSRLLKQIYQQDHCGAMCSNISMAAGRGYFHGIQLPLQLARVIEGRKRGISGMVLY